MKDGFLGHIAVIVVLLGGLWYGFARYQDDVVMFLNKDTEQTIMVGGTQLRVDIADESDERAQGLSGVRALGANQGMLFIFDRDDDWGMWMKDMEIAIDMLWVDKNLTVVHVEENVTPETFPKTFSAGIPTRFVIEAPAFFVRNNNITLGDTVYIPEVMLPADIRPEL